MQKRIKILLFIFLAVLSGLLTRMFYLQVVEGSSLAQEASAQRMRDVKIESARGDFLDKNGISLTNRTEKITAVLKPSLLKGQSETIEQICKVLGLDPVKTEEQLAINKTPILTQIDKETKVILSAMNVEGVSFINSQSRYSTDTLAKHILGYLNTIDNVGINGLEKLYDKTLNYGENDSIAVITDGGNNLLDGLGYRIIRQEADKNKKLDIKLTLDYHIQSIAEQALDSRGLTGAVVVEDISNGNIVAITSKPDFDPNNIESYLTNIKRPLFNRAVAQYNVGSIFKLVDLAAVFEQQPTFNMIFNCPGYIQVGDTEFKCSSYNRGGHGTIDINSALSVSCNPYFMTLALNLGAEPIIAMSYNLGLGNNTGLTAQGIAESKGTLPKASELTNPGDIANISIGQGGIMATPVQLADLVATIANDGVKNNVNLVDCIVDSEGNKVRNLKDNGSKRVLSKTTAERIQGLMEGVVSGGTGNKANLENGWGAGGKTGSAETGQYIDGEKIVQAWFVGYFPAKNPKYSVAVLIEDGKSGGEAAAPVFAEIGNQIMRKGL